MTQRIRTASTLLIVSLVAIAVFGCAPPGQHLTFPTSPLTRGADGDWYDVSGDGRPDFAMLRDPATGRLNTLAYDDDQDGRQDRIYRLDDYANESVPHLIILMDSIPCWAMAERWAAGEFGW